MKCNSATLDVWRMCFIYDQQWTEFVLLAINHTNYLCCCLSRYRILTKLQITVIDSLNLYFLDILSRANLHNFPFRFSRERFFDAHTWFDIHLYCSSNINLSPFLDLLLSFPIRSVLYTYSRCLTSHHSSILPRSSSHCTLHSSISTRCKVYTL